MTSIYIFSHDLIEWAMGNTKPHIELDRYEQSIVLTIFLARRALTTKQYTFRENVLLNCTELIKL